jgi:site-specific recombinase XerC
MNGRRRRVWKASARWSLRKQRLAAIRQLFDYLTTGGILDVNPAASVRGPRYVVKRGKTPVLSSEEARKLLDSIEGLL